MKKKATYIPLILLTYLVIMAFIGREHFFSGNYLYYFGVIGATLLCIIILHFAIKHRERLRREREDDQRKNS